MHDIFFVFIFVHKFGCISEFSHLKKHITHNPKSDSEIGGHHRYSPDFRNFLKFTCIGKFQNFYTNFNRKINYRYLKIFSLLRERPHNT